MSAPLFKGLTRPVSFMGLPMTYVAMMMIIVIGGFIGTLSFTYLIVSGVVCYVALRALANYDPRIFDVFFSTIRSTPFTSSQLKGKGVTYGP